jgi:hypothetical protein
VWQKVAIVLLACGRPSSSSNSTGYPQGIASGTEHILTDDKMTYISLDERLLAQLNGFHNAYADLARLKGSDLDAAGDDATKMALELLTSRAERPCMLIS